MQFHSNLDRPNLSDAVVEMLREFIVDGRLAAGERVNEVHLAAQLKISRTPLREALGRLVAEGALTSSPRLGFFVCPLTIDEVEQIYPIRALLDPEALRLSGLPTPKRLARLEAMNREIARTDDPESVIALDNAWHLELVAACPNTTLLELIRQFIRRTHRYELAAMRGRANVERAVGNHDDILAALRDENLEGARAALHENMETGKEPILAWLRESSMT